MNNSFIMEAIMKVTGASKFQQAFANAEQSMKKFEKVGQQLTGVGKSLTKGLTLPIVGMGVASLKVGKDFEAGMSQVQATTGASAKDMEMLEGVAREMGSSTKYSATEASEGLNILAMSGMDTADMASTLEPVLKLAGAAGLELDEAAGIVTNSLGQFNLEADQATRITDVMAKGASIANTDVSQLGGALETAGSGANAMGYDIESTTALLARFADEGLVGSEAGTAMNAMFRDMKKASKDGKIELNGQNVEIVDAQGNYREFTDIVKDMNKATEDLTPAQRDQANATIFGDTAMKGFLKVTGDSIHEVSAYEEQLRSADGAASDMYDTMQDNLRGSIDNLKSAFEEAGISLSKILIPMMEKVVGVIQNLVDKFNGLSDESKKSVVRIGLILAAVGPLLLIGGKLIGVIGTMSGVIGVMGGSAVAATPFVGGLAAVLGAVTGPGLLAAGAIGGIVFAGKKLVDHLSKDAIPEVNLFGDEVSESTAQAVGGFMDMTKESIGHLKELVWGQQEITQEMVGDMAGKQQEITDTLLTAIDERHQEERSLAQSEFEKTTALTQEQKDQILENIDAHYEKEKESAQEGNDRINEILAVAAEEGRELKKHEMMEIEKLTNDMNTTAIETMSQSAIEQQAIKEQLVNSSTELSAREAAEVVQKATEKKDGVIAEANEQYDETVAWAIAQRDEHGTMSAQEAAQVIADAERQRDDSVSAAEEMHEDVVAAAKEQAGEHVGQVDWETGEVLSKWQVMSRGVDEQSKKMQEAVHRNVMKMVDGMKENISNMVTRTKEDLQELANIDLSAAGKAIIDGFINGMKSIWEGGKKWVKGIGTWIKDNKGPISYDRKLLTPAGNAIISGLNKGLEDSFPQVQNTVSSMAGAIQDSFTSNPTMDINGNIARSNAQVKSAVSHEIGDNRGVQQPAYLTVELGRRAYRGFVEDINNAQSQSIQFEEAYGL